MNLKSEIVHIDSDRVIIRIEGYRNGKSLGSALGEAKRAEEAEDRAISRFKNRYKIEAEKLNDSNLEVKQEKFEAKIHEDNSLNSIDRSLQKKEIDIEHSQEVNLPITEVTDWSNELTAIDHHLRRIGWSKDEENQYINFLFNKPNRNRITNYQEIQFLVIHLKDIKENENINNKTNSEEKNNQLKKSDEQLKRLGWDSTIGRNFLNEHFKCIDL